MPPIEYADGDWRREQHEKQAHSRFLRATKDIRDAIKKPENDFYHREIVLEARCGRPNYCCDLDGKDSISMLSEYLDCDEYGNREARIAFLEQLAPVIEQACASIAGFKTWGEFEAAYQKKLDEWEAACEAEDAASKEKRAETEAAEAED